MSGASSSDAEVGSSALSKASWRILPLIVLSYLSAYMDRVTIGFAAIRMNVDGDDRDRRVSRVCGGLVIGDFSAHDALAGSHSHPLAGREHRRDKLGRLHPGFRRPVRMGYRERFHR